MKHKNKSKLETDYHRFERSSNFFAYFITATTLICGIAFIFVTSDDAKLLFGCLLYAITILVIAVASQIAKRRNKYLTLLAEEGMSCVRTGVFKEIYEEYKHDGFEFNLTFDKLLYCEYYNNSIDISLLRKSTSFQLVLIKNQFLLLQMTNPIHRLKRKLHYANSKT